MVSYTGRQALVAVKEGSAPVYTEADQTQSVSFDFDGSLEDIHHLGSRDPQDIKEGTIAISGTLERLFETGDFSAMGTTLLLACQGNPLTEYYVAIFPKGDDSITILMSNVKFGGWSFSTDIGSPVTESVTFRGLAVAVS